MEHLIRRLDDGTEEFIHEPESQLNALLRFTGFDNIMLGITLRGAGLKTPGATYFLRK